MKKILITGATGFTGANLVRRLLNEGGSEIHILTRARSDMWRLTGALDRVHNHAVDLWEGEKLESILGEVRPDYIFHLANAGIYGGVSVSDKDLLKTNTEGFMNLVAALEDVDYRGFVNVGSSSEYGLKDAPMAETDVCEPMNAYAVSKVAATNYASFIAKTKNKPIITLRFFSPFGPYDDHRRLVSKVILDLLRGCPLTLANPAAARDYLYMEDALDLFMEAMDKAGALKGEVFNLGSGKERKVSDVVALIASRIDPKAKIEWGTAAPRPWEPKRWEADMRKTFSAFAWRPQTSFEEGIARTVAWFRENQGLYNF